MNTRLKNSFQATCTLLDTTPGVARRFLIVLLIVQSCVLAYCAYATSPTHNEPAHLVAGLSHWDFGKFDVYRVNPPLVRMVAAIPVILVGYREDWSSFHDELGARPEFNMGEAFVAANGQRSLWLFTIARWACIPFSWLGMLVCYLWARDLYSRSAGILAAVIWCFEPTILGNASLIAPDAHATSLAVAACYTFWRWLKDPTWSRLAISGVFLGLAELAKTTFIVLFAIWPLLWIVYRWPDRHKMASAAWLRELGMIATRMAVAIYILNAGYGFEKTFMPLKDFHFVSDLLTGNVPAEIGKQTSHSTPVGTTETKNSDNRFADTIVGETPIPLPKNYVLGIDIQQRDFERYPRPSYLRGKWKRTGWWYYYAYSLVIKVPLGVWILVLIVVFHRACFRIRVVDWRDECALLLPAAAIFVVVSAKTGFSEHVRYVLPAYPFGFVWIAIFTAAIANSHQRVPSGVRSKEPPDANNELNQCWANVCTSFFPHCACSLIVWFVISSIWIFPHSLSYFNELIGGPLNGAEHLLGSGVDWGQDLTYLRDWNARRTDNLPLFLAYHGYFRPTDIGFQNTLPFKEERGKDNSLSLERQASSGVYAISVSLLYGMPWYAQDGKEVIRGIDSKLLFGLRSRQPSHRMGYSILVYEMPASPNGE